MARIEEGHFEVLYTCTKCKDVSCDFIGTSALPSGEMHPTASLQLFKYILGTKPSEIVKWDQLRTANSTTGKEEPVVVWKAEHPVVVSPNQPAAGINCRPFAN